MKDRTKSASRSLSRPILNDYTMWNCVYAPTRPSIFLLFFMDVNKEALGGKDKGIAFPNSKFNMATCVLAH